MNICYGIGIVAFIFHNLAEILPLVKYGTKHFPQDQKTEYASDKDLSTLIYYNDYMVNTTSSESEFHIFYHIFSQNDDAERYLCYRY